MSKMYIPRNCFMNISNVEKRLPIRQQKMLLSPEICQADGCRKGNACEHCHFCNATETRKKLNRRLANGIRLVHLGILGYPLGNRDGNGKCSMNFPMYCFPGYQGLAPLWPPAVLDGFYSILRVLLHLPSRSILQQIHRQAEDIIRMFITLHSLLPSILLGFLLHS